MNAVSGPVTIKDKEVKTSISAPIKSGFYASTLFNRTKNISNHEDSRIIRQKNEEHN